MTRNRGEKRRGPEIERITHLTATSRRKLRSARAGDVLRVTGRNFGTGPAGTSVLFDGVETRPYSSPFSPELIVVTAPLPQNSFSTVRVRVRGRGTSEPYSLGVRRPERREDAPGGAMRELLQALDEQAALTARLIRLVGVLPMLNPARKTSLAIAADAIDGARLTLPRAYEAWMQWAPLQATEAIEPLQTIAFLDEIIDISGITDIVRRGTDALFGPGGLVDEFLPGGVRRLIEGFDLVELAEAIAEIFDIEDLLKRIREIGAYIGENVISQEAIEDILKVVKPSIEGGASLVIQGSLDAEFDIAQIISGLAGFLGLGGSVVEEAGGDSERLDRLIEIVAELTDAIARLEVKQDRLEGFINEMDDRARTTTAEVFANEQKLDLLGELLGLTLVGSAWVVDDRATRTGPNIVPDRDVKKELHDIEDAVKRLEEKDDRQEQKLDVIEEKLDREEEKLDRLGVLDRPQEGSIASQRNGADRVTGAVTATRTAGDRVHLRSAIDVTREDLADEAKWSDWVDFGRPQAAARLVTVSLDLQYEDGSNSRMTALLSARDASGTVFHREFRGPEDADLLDPTLWGDWQEFLGQP
jgi:hypothetical protein